MYGKLSIKYEVVENGLNNSQIENKYVRLIFYTYRVPKRGSNKVKKVSYIITNL